jgi:hypothetical protein
VEETVMDLDTLTALLLDPCLTVEEAEQEAAARVVPEEAGGTLWDSPLVPRTSGPGG